MRKRIIEQEAHGASPAEDEGWLDLEQVVEVELTSEDEQYPIEGALSMNGESGWRAQQSGQQAIRLLFDMPRHIRRIQVMFQEDERQRTQEFVMRWSGDHGASWREIVRQQYNFGPPDSTREIEDYNVDLDGLTMLELSIIPDIGRGEVHASLARLRLA